MTIQNWKKNERLSRKPYWIIGLLLALSGGIRFYYAWQPLPALLKQGIADDAFYYLTIARNLSSGIGASFDGLTATNGFHPLYVWMLVPVFRIIPSSPQTAINLALSILMSFNLLTVVPLYFTVSSVSTSQGGLFASLLWLCNPWVLIVSLAGVESSVYIFFAALTIWLYFQLILSRNTNNAALTVCTGLCLGLTILSRSDGIFLLSAILLEWGISWRRYQRQKKQPLSWKTLSPVLILVGVSLACLSPWLLWNRINFGYLTQISGMAVYWHTHSEVNTMVEWLKKLLISTGRTAYGSLYFTSQIVVVGLSILLFRLLTPRAKTYAQLNDSEGRRRLRLVFGLYTAQIFAFYAFYLWQQQFWYFMPIILASTFYGGILFSQHQNAPGVFKGILIITILVLASVTWWRWQSGWMQIYPAQQNVLWITEQLSTRSEPQARIGAWNSGLLGYLSGRTVINLDGVVNNRLYAYVYGRKDSFFDLCANWEYIRASRIDFLTDYEDIWSTDIDKYFSDHLVVWAEAPSVRPGGSYPVRIYQVLDNPMPLPTQSCPNALKIYK